MNNKIKAYIGFAINKGSVIFGIDNIVKSKLKIKLVLLCKFTQKNTRKEAAEFCEKKNIRLLETAVPLEELASRNGVKVLAITDTNLAQAIIKNSDEEDVCGGVN